MNLAISDFFMLFKCPIVIYNSFRLGPALGDWGKCVSLYIKDDENFMVYNSV